MSKYKTLIYNPPKIEVKENPREAHFKVISCMCDNEAKISFRRKEDGQYSVSASNSHCSLSMTNFQMKGDYETDLVWAAEDNDWATVIRVINSGTSKVESVRAR